MKKKKVTAPLTYDPGKGRPKEHLAYLNYQEMQALKRLNGNNQERGPMGLPSFPPDDARGSSSKASSSKSSGGKMGASSSQSGGVKGGTTTGKTTTKSSGPGGGMMGGSGSGGSSRTSPSKANAAGKDTGAGRSGGGAGPRSGVSGTRSPTSGSTTGSGKGPSMSKDTGGKSPAPRSGLEGSRSPTSGGRLSSSGQKPGGIADLGGGKRASGDTPGSKIKGAIAAVKNPVNYTTAPRYNQPQAQRMANPTAIPSMERTSAERMNLAEAARRREATAAAQLARTGPFGVPGYTGTYNPKTGRYDARPVAATPKPTNFNKYEALAAYKGPFGPELTAAVGSPIERAMTGQYEKLAAYKGPFGPELTAAVGSPIERAMTGQYDKLAAYKGPFGPEMAAAVGSTVEKSVLTGKPLEKFGPAPQKLDIAKIIEEQNRFEKEIRDLDRRDITTFDEPRYNAEETLRAYEAAKRAATTRGITEINIPGGGLPVAPGNTTVLGGPDRSGQRKAIADRIAGQRMAYDTSPATVNRLKANFEAAEYDRKLNGANVKPMGYEQPGETFGEVETVPEPKVLAYDPSYGPQYVSPEVQEEMRRQDKINRAGVKVMKAIDRTGILRAGDALLDTFTGRGIADRTADLKRSYMQSDPATRAQMEAKYPNLTKFANDAGVGSQLSMDNYKSWQDRSGLGGQGGRQGGGDRGGIASLTTPSETVAPSPSDSTTGTGSGNDSGGGRPYIHFQWDLGLNIPKPTDPNYADYQKYLADRAASAAALESA